jgi:hypothetical protein
LLQSRQEKILASALLLRCEAVQWCQSSKQAGWEGAFACGASKNQYKILSFLEELKEIREKEIL